MPMTRDEHEEILSKLLDRETPTSELTEYLQKLRADYGGVLKDFDDLTQSKTKLEKDNADLVLSNSKLFRDLKITAPEDKEEETQKAFSETVTIDQLEKA